MIPPSDELVEETDLVEVVPPSTVRRTQGRGERETTFSSLMGDKQFRHRLRKKNTFIYGKVGFFEPFLVRVFGKNWQEGRWSVLIKATEQLKEISASKRTLILIPAVQTGEEFNQLIAAALALQNPVWLVGYPSTVHRHLWANFSCFILSPAPEVEIRVLQDIVGLNSSEIGVLSIESRASVGGLIVTPEEMVYLKKPLA